MRQKFLVFNFLLGFSLCQITQGQNSENQGQENADDSSTTRTTDTFFFSTDSIIDTTTIIPEEDNEKDSSKTSNVNVSTDQIFNTETSSKELPTNSTEASNEKQVARNGEDNKESTKKVQNLPPSPAVKNLQERQSKPGDVREDFLHFVQTALRSGSKKEDNISRNSPNAPELIKRLIGITPRLRNKPILQRTPADLLSIGDIFKTDGHNNDNSHKNNILSDQNKYTQQEEEPSHSTLPHHFSSRSKNPLQPRRIGQIYKNHMIESERQLVTTEHNIIFKGVNSKTPTDIGFGFFSSTPDYLTERTWPEPYYQNQNHQRKPGSHNKYKSIFEQEFEAFSSNLTPLKGQIKPFTPQRKQPEDEYDPVESKRQAESAKYSFASDIKDNINGNQQHRQETREGTKVTGSYTYEDGFYRRTVHYVADEHGYRVVKEEVDEIGNGPAYNPDGSAKFHATIGGTNVNYQITNKDIYKMPHTNYQIPEQQYTHGWKY